MHRMKALAVFAASAMVLAACSAGNNTTASGGGSNVTLTIAAVQGVEDTGLKALAPMYTAKTGVKINIVEAPYADLYTKLVNAFQLPISQTIPIRTPPIRSVGQCTDRYNRE